MKKNEMIFDVHVIFLKSQQCFFPHFCLFVARGSVELSFKRNEAPVFSEASCVKLHLFLMTAAADHSRIRPVCQIDNLSRAPHVLSR